MGVLKGQTHFPTKLKKGKAIRFTFSVCRHFLKQNTGLDFRFPALVSSNISFNEEVGKTFVLPLKLLFRWYIVYIRPLSRDWSRILGIIKNWYSVIGLLAFWLVQRRQLISFMNGKTRQSINLRIVKKIPRRQPEHNDIGTSRISLKTELDNLLSEM